MRLTELKPSTEEEISYNTGKTPFGEDHEFEDDDGQRRIVPSSEFQSAVDAGFKYIPAEQVQRETEFADAGEKPVLAGALSLLRGTTLGLSDQIIKKTGMFSEQELGDLQDANPISSTTGEIAGTVLPALFSGGTSLGAKAVAMAPSALAELAGKKVAQKLTGKFLSQTTSNVVKSAVRLGTGSAVEGALFGAGKLISENALGDAEFNAENLLAYSGGGALIGLGAGSVGSLAASGFVKGAGAIKSKVRELRRSVINKANLDDISKQSIINKISIEEKVEDYLTKAGVNKEDLLAQMDNSADTLVFDSTELMASSERLGVPVTEGMQLGGLHRELEGSLTKSKSIAGDWTRKRVQKTYDGLETVKNEMLKEAADLDPVAIGVNAKQGMRASIESELEPAKLLYQELKPIMIETPITESLKKRFVTVQGKDYLNRVAGDGESWLKKMSRVETIDDVTKLRSDVRADMAGATGTLKTYLSGLYDNLTTLRQNAIQFNLKGKPFKSKTGQIADTSEALKLADSIYRETHKKYDFLKKQFSIRSDNMDNFLDKFDEVSDKAISDKILSLNNIDTAKKFQEYFPEVYEMARAKRLSEIAKKSSHEGTFSPKKFINSVSSLGESDLAILFPSIKNPKQVLKDYKKLTDNLPPLTNPSGTAYEQALQGMMSLPYQAQEAARYLLYRSSGDKFKQRMQAYIPELANGAAPSGLKISIDQQIPVMSGIEKASNKGKLNISNAVDAFFKSVNDSGKVAGRAGVRYLTGSEVSHAKEEEIQDKIQVYSQDPAAIVDEFVEKNQAMINSAPKTAQALQQRVINAAQFLNSKVPKQDDSPFKDTPRSRSEVMKFKNYVEAVENPYKTLENLKHGYFSPESMEAMKVVYPKMFAAVREEMMHRLPEFKKISEKQKAEISKILNIETKKAYSPAGFAKLQQISANGTQQNIQQSNSSGSKKLDVSGRSQTGLERVLAR